MFWVLFHQGLCGDQFRKVVSWFSFRQDASETLLKRRNHRCILLKKKKKNGQGRSKQYTCSFGGAELWLFMALII